MQDIIQAGKARIPVLYEDNHLLVVVKPANLPSQGDSSGDDGLPGTCAPAGSARGRRNGVCPHQQGGLQARRDLPHP